MIIMSSKDYANQFTKGQYKLQNGVNINASEHDVAIAAYRKSGPDTVTDINKIITCPSVTDDKIIMTVGNSYLENGAIIDGFIKFVLNKDETLNLSKTFKCNSDIVCKTQNINIKVLSAVCIILFICCIYLYNKSK